MTSANVRRRGRRIAEQAGRWPALFYPPTVLTPDS